LKTEVQFHTTINIITIINSNVTKKCHVIDNELDFSDRIAFTQCTKRLHTLLGSITRINTYITHSPNAVVKFLTFLFTLGSQFKSTCNFVDVDAASFESLSFHAVKSLVFRQFVNSCNGHYLVLLIFIVFSYITCQMCIGT